MTWGQDAGDPQAALPGWGPELGRAAKLQQRHRRGEPAQAARGLGAGRAGRRQDWPTGSHLTACQPLFVLPPVEETGRPGRPSCFLSLLTREWEGRGRWRSSRWAGCPPSPPGRPGPALQRGAPPAPPRGARGGRKCWGGKGNRLLAKTVTNESLTHFYHPDEPTLYKRQPRGTRASRVTPKEFFGVPKLFSPPPSSQKAAGGHDPPWLWGSPSSKHYSNHQIAPWLPATGSPQKTQDAGLGRPHGYPWCHPTRDKRLGQDWGRGLHSCKELCQEGPRSEEADPKAPGG